MSEVKISNEALDDFLKGDLGDFLSTTKNIDEQVKTLQVAQANGLPTPEGVTLALEGFLEQGSTVLETMTIYCNNMPDSESVNSFAALLNALSGAINNIASLYKTEQTHRNRIELEERKSELRMKEIEFKERLRAKNKPGETAANIEEDSETMIEFSTADVVNQLIDAKKE
jgi:hypothetical protein